MAADSVVGTDQAYDQVIYQFGAASSASAFVAGIQSLAGRCASFTAPAGTGTTATFSLWRRRGSRGRAVQRRARAVGEGVGVGVTLDTLLVASGVDVFAAAGVGLGTGAPAVPAKETIIYNLMKRQAAAAVLG